MVLLENGSGIQVVDHVTLATPVDNQSTPLGFPKNTRLSSRCAAFRTIETGRMKIFCDPVDATAIIEQISNWKFHTSSQYLRQK